MSAPAEGPAAPALALRSCLKVKAYRHGRAFRIVEIQGSNVHRSSRTLLSIPITLNQWERLFLHIEALSFTFSF